VELRVEAAAADDDEVGLRVGRIGEEDVLVQVLLRRNTDDEVGVTG